MSNTRLILHSLKEIEVRLMEEVDYHIEAQNMQWFRNNIKLNGISVAKIYPELSSEGVIITEFIEGCIWMIGLLLSHHKHSAITWHNFKETKTKE